VTDKVVLAKHNAVYNKIIAEPSVIQEIADHFTFYVPNYQFNPKYKARVWDGKIRLVNQLRPYLYGGLKEKLREFCITREYEFETEFKDADDEFSVKEANDFVATIGLPKVLNEVPFEVRDYQLNAFIHGVRKSRCVLLAPTASGKSLIAYLFTRYFNAKTLIIVPTLGLVDQMYDDFGTYGFDVKSHMHRIYGGQEKRTNHQVTVSTWQSLKDMDAEYFSQFDVVLGDEVHGFKATELKGIMERLEDCWIRIGMSGTLDGAPTNELVITGLFGPIYKVTTTSALIASKKLAEFMIKSIVLVHPERVRKAMSKKDYQTELDYIVQCEARNRFITNLALSLKGNTLITFRFVEKHGEVLKKMIEKEALCPVLYVSGKVPSEEREIIRKFVNEQHDSITIASSGTFSTGTNIPNLDNLIFSSPAKSLILVLQSIGRVLRRSVRKSTATLYDIADDFVWKSWINHTLNHFSERIKIYAKERFPYKIYRVALEY
jgi:superfamily II DNA or RNA helicase